MKYTIYFFIICFSILTACSGETDLPEVTPINNPEQEVDETKLEDAPGFSLKSLDGGDLSLTQFKDKVLVIFFFGHNCPPCISAGPTMEEELNLAFNNKADFEMIGIDVWDGNNAQVQSFKDKTKSTYPLGLDGSGVGTSFSSGRDRLVIVNKEGKIAFSGNQVAKNDLDDVVKLLNTLL